MDKVAYEAGAEQALVDVGVVNLEKEARFGAYIEPALQRLRGLLEAGGSKLQALGPARAAGAGALAGGGVAGLAGGDVGDVMMGAGAGGLAGGMGGGGVSALLKRYPQLTTYAGQQGMSPELLRKLMTGAGATGAAGLGLGALT